MIELMETHILSFVLDAVQPIKKNFYLLTSFHCLHDDYVYFLLLAQSAFLTRYTGVYTEHRKYYPVFAHRALLAQNLGEVVDLSFCENRGTFSNVNLFI